MKRMMVLFMMIFVIEAQAANLKEDDQHILTWNAFAQNLLKLHQKLIQGKDIRVEKKRGGYVTIKNWHYDEERYIDQANNKLISQLQWGSDSDRRLHTIEVYVRNPQGRVIRDYTAAFLPLHHTAPIQTLITLHHYHPGLHAFRTFDASGYRIVERCDGTYQGKTVQLLLDEDEIADMKDDKHSIMQSAVYKACFGNLPTVAGIYLQPQ